MKLILLLSLILSVNSCQLTWPCFTCIQNGCEYFRTKSDFVCALNSNHVSKIRRVYTTHNECNTLVPAQSVPVPPLPVLNSFKKTVKTPVQSITPNPSDFTNTYVTSPNSQAFSTRLDPSPIIPADTIPIHNTEAFLPEKNPLPIVSPATTRIYNTQAYPPEQNPSKSKPVTTTSKPNLISPTNSISTSIPTTSNPDLISTTTTITTSITSTSKPDLISHTTTNLPKTSTNLPETTHSTTNSPEPSTSTYTPTTSTTPFPKTRLTSTTSFPILSFPNKSKIEEANSYELPLLYIPTNFSANDFISEDFELADSPTVKSNRIPLPFHVSEDGAYMDGKLILPLAFHNSNFAIRYIRALCRLRMLTKVFRRTWNSGFNRKLDFANPMRRFRRECAAITAQHKQERNLD